MILATESESESQTMKAILGSVLLLMMCGINYDDE